MTAAPLTAEEQARIDAWADDPDGMLSEARRAEAAKVASGRSWAALVISRDLATCRAVLRGDPVLARHLDPLVLRRALRGGPLPPAAEFLEVDAVMLDAAAEAGPLHPKACER